MSAPLKRYMNAAFLYAIFAMVGGVFYREFTKYMKFSAWTTLSVVHTHYFLLGMVFFLVLLLLEKNFSFSQEKTKKTTLVYQIGVNLTALMLLVRGITQVLACPLPRGCDAAISGISGLGHICVGVCMILLLLNVKTALVTSDRA